MIVLCAAQKVASVVRALNPNWPLHLTCPLVQKKVEHSSDPERDPAQLMTVFLEFSARSANASFSDPERIQSLPVAPV